MSGYKTYGICQYGGTLDYVVGLHLNTNELRVVRLQFNQQTNISSEYTYKVVDKQLFIVLEDDEIYVDCSFIDNFKGSNTYIIGIAGRFFYQSVLASYYIAKFSTKYNLTEYFVTSFDNPFVMEIPRSIRVDPDNELIYLALEINQNQYNERTVYQPGNLPLEDNSNVAILGFSWTHGVRIWTTVLGNDEYSDSFASMEFYGNYLYIFLNSFSTEYSTNSSQIDIYYYRMRCKNGYTEKSKIFGSPSDEFVYDVKITYNGIYILALINNGLLPHKYNDKIWQTQNQNANIALILMDFDDDILDIEGYSLDQFQNVPYPTKVFLGRLNDHNQTFIFASSRSNNAIDNNGGIFITYYSSPLAAFVQNFSCGDTCKRCNPQMISKCLECRPGFYLWKHTCLQGSCPLFTFNVFDEAQNSLKICSDCHYTCRTCSGAKKDNCQTCCTNNICGPIKNRIPELGKCECPQGLVDSNGVCVQRCIMNLAGRRDDFCYTRCPTDSSPDIRYDQALQAQERSQFDQNSRTDCQVSSYHLKFSRDGYGLPVQGPSQFAKQMPKEFTIAFWIRYSELRQTSYFFQAFERISIMAHTNNQSVRFQYKTGPNSFIEPTYSGSQINFQTWTYISASLRQTLINNILRYEQQLAIAKSNTATVQSVGYKNTDTPQPYNLFNNIIYLGAQNDITPNSFTGYMKEFKLFSKFHGLAQMKDELLRLYRWYSYDDPNLVAYWKLSEAYTSSDNQYTIRDYSMNNYEISYSIVSLPNYPKFELDYTFELSLCYFHDVALCRSVDYSETHPIVTQPKRLTQEPMFVLSDSYFHIQDGDQVWYVFNNTRCNLSNKLAYMTYRSTQQSFLVEDSLFNPANLMQGQHYEICYFNSSMNLVFHLYQVYVAELPATIDPSNRDAYMSNDVQRKWSSSGGDQAYGDFIIFSTDCDDPSKVSYIIMRSLKPDYGTHFVKNFNLSGNFFFCWQPVFVQDMSPFPYFESIYDLKYRIVGEPKLSGTTISYANMNEDLIRFDFVGDSTFADGDQLAFSWRGSSGNADCNPSNFLSKTYVHNYTYWPSIWFGYEQGVFGVKNQQMDEVHMCYKSRAADAPDSWTRIKKITGHPYQVKINKYNILSNTKLPEFYQNIQDSFNPLYGSTMASESDSAIRFQFKDQLVTPNEGSIRIFKGAVSPDGRIIKTNVKLWEIPDLSSPIKSLDLQCSQKGSCTIMLSKQLEKIQAGGIYYLAYYLQSFNTVDLSTKYYLFNNKLVDNTQKIAYEHMFFCRSFNIFQSTDLVNGNKLIIYGTDLLSKEIEIKEYKGQLINSIFTTKAINIDFYVMNTNNPFCIGVQPVATIKMSDVAQSLIYIYNMDLKFCNTGALIGDFEVIRGIRNQNGEFTHIRSEYQKSVQLGQIGCHSSCLQCNGTTENDCTICNDFNQFLYMGKCYTKCPIANRYFNQDEHIYQKKKYSQNECMAECSFGTYADKETDECLPCNPDCQTCNSSFIASCLSCNPIKYLFNQMCVNECPAPHFINNYTDYTCYQVSSTKLLEVKIQSLGYKSRIPKDQQTYLKASIDNRGGNIISILWEQLEPEPINDNMLIFAKDIGGDIDNKQSVVKLKMTAFNYMHSDQVVKVKCTVINSIGDIGFDIYEFYTNEPPIKGNITVIWGTPQNQILTSPQTNYSLNLTNFTEANDDNILKYRIFMKVESKYYTLTDLILPTNYPTTQDILNFQFSVPLVSNIQPVKNISICVAVVDYYDAYVYNCQLIQNVNNNLTYIQDIQSLINLLKPLTYETPTGYNLTNALYASQNLYFALSEPKRTPLGMGICSSDFHCNFKGKCVSQKGIQLCECRGSFFGTYCQYEDLNFMDLKNISTSIVRSVHKYLKSKFSIKTEDIEMAGNIFRGVMKDPDLISDQDLVKIVEIIEIIGNASEYAFYPLTQDLVEIYLDFLSATLIKVQHSFSYQRAFPNSFQSPQAQSMNQGLEKTNIIGRYQVEFNVSSKEEIYANWGRILNTQINNFINLRMQILDPENPQFTYRSKAFDLLIEVGFAPQFKNRKIYIRSKDMYWFIPEEIFDNSQNFASDLQEVRIKLVKWYINPFLYEKQPQGFVESNATTVTFYTSDNEEIPIIMSLNSYVEVREPWSKSQGYERELMRCMAWDDEINQFVPDNSCSFASFNDIVPCATCEEGKEYITQVSSCRCQHLSTFAAVYMQTVPSIGVGSKPNIYSDFFAMQYWSQSFGWYATLAAMITFFVGHFIFFWVDRWTIPKMYVTLREKVKEFESKGFKQKTSKHKIFDIYTPNQQLFIRQIEKSERKKLMDEKDKVKKGPKSGDPIINENIEVSQVNQLNELVENSKKKKPSAKKNFKMEDSPDLLMPSQSKKKINSQRNLIELDVKNTDDMEENKLSEQSIGQMSPKKAIEHFDLIKLEDQAALEKEMQRRYMHEVKTREWRKLHPDKSSSDEHMDLNKAARNKDQKRFVKMEKLREEYYWFKVKNLIIHGNFILSLLYVTSILSPRHVRWTLTFCCITMNWFWCAVIFNNTKDPLAIPDFDRKARNLAINDLWVAFVSPFGTIILMYIFAGLFKISDSRIRQSFTVIYLENMLIQLRKEMRLRFIIAYFITVCIFAAIFWYIVKFTTTFGWKVSWVWWYCGVMALVIQNFVIDPISSLIHWVIYYCSKQLALFIMKVRILKQAKEEA